MAPTSSRGTLRTAAWLLLAAGCAAIAPQAAAQSASNATTSKTDAGDGLRGAVTDPTTTGTALDGTDDSFADDAAREDFGRLNPREGTIDGTSARNDPDRNEPTGIRLGSFILKPSLSQTVNHESTKTGTTRENRSFLETGLKGTLTSDWSRHQLTVTGEGYYQKNIGGTGETDPRADIDAELRLDLSDDTTARLKAGYGFEREDSTDPNAISNATVQSGIDKYNLGAEVTRDFGVLRGTAGVDVDRSIYGDAELSDGSSLSLADRDRSSGTLRARVGYELSPALIPFLEASMGTSRYDLRRDSLGYERSYKTYAGRGGVEVDLGEKLRGEFALGYETVSFEDSRLNDLKGLTFDSRIDWSPRRGTDVSMALSTAIEPSTTAGESGALVYALRNGLTHELRSSLVARLSNSFTFRNYPGDSLSADEVVWSAGAGLTWDFNRYLALTGDVSFERTKPSGGTATDVAKIGVGLTMRR